MSLYDTHGPASVRRPETTWQIKAKFYVKPPWVEGTSLFAASESHD